MKQRHLWLCLAALAAGLVSLTGCKTLGFVVEEEIRTADSGKTIEREVGEEVKFILSGNPHRPFKWVEVQRDAAILKPRESNPKMKITAAGAGFASVAEYTYVYDVKAAGETVLRFEYIDPDNPDAAPADEFELHIIAKR